MSQTSTAKKSVENNVETAPMQVVKIDQPIAQALAASKPEPLAPAPAPEPAAAPVLTLEQKINKVEDLSMLIDKWRKLQESYRSLQTFQVSTDGFTNQIILRESNNGREFRTSNTAVVTRIVEEIKSTLHGKITEVEQQIRF